MADESGGGPARSPPDLSRFLAARRSTTAAAVPPPQPSSSYDERSRLISRSSAAPNSTRLQQPPDTPRGKLQLRRCPWRRKPPPPMEYQTIELEDGLTATIHGYRPLWWRTALYWLLCAISGGVVYLLSRWFVKLRLWFTCEPTRLASATVVLVQNSWGHAEVCRVRQEHHGEDDLATIYKSLDGSPSAGSVTPATDDAVLLGHQPPIYSSANTAPTPANDGILRRVAYRCTNYCFIPGRNAFVPLSEWNDSVRAVSKMALGLDRRTYSERKSIFGVNNIVIPEKSTGRLLVDEVLHPFYIFQVISIILWCFESYYYYAACIFLISSVSSLLSLRETKANLRRLRDMARLQCNLRVLRSGVWLYASSEELVPGDVYELASDLGSFPCDSLLLAGDCIVNESMLTGESIPVFKSPANLDGMTGHFSNDVDKLDPKHVLFCGTQLIRARMPAPDASSGQQRVVMAMVLRTGFNTMKGSLIRSIMYPKPSTFQFYRDSFRFVGVMAGIAAIGFVFCFVSFMRSGVSWFFIIIRASDLITIVVPPALPAAMSVGTNFSLGRLRLRNIYCIAPSRVNVCGKLNVMVFDKTGTLTEDGLDVLGVQQVTADGQGFQDLHTTLTSVSVARSNSDATPTFLHGLTTCHSLKKLAHSLVGDPLDLKMFQFTQWSLEESDDHGVVPTIVRPVGPKTLNSTFLLKPAGELKSQTGTVNTGGSDQVELGVIRCFEFLANLRRMSVIVKHLDGGHIFAYCKGAPEVIREICDPATVPAEYDKLLNTYTRDGYRVIALAGKYLPGCTWMQAQKMNRSDVEADLKLLGLIVFENKLKRETSAALSMLYRANIRDVMCTGDNLHTAISVGKSCQLIEEHAAVYVPSFVNTQPAVVQGDAALRVDAAAQIVWQCIDDPRLQLDPVTLLPVHNPLPLSAQQPSATSSVSGSLTFGDVRLSSTHGTSGQSAVGPSAVYPIPAPHHHSGDMNFSLAVTGDVFDFYLDKNNFPPATLHRLLVKADVFARMSPDQKHVLVEQLQAIGYCAGMCGDGANDCGALKAADVGVSLSEAEASVAAPFASRTSNIDCVLDIIREGRAALVTSFSCFQYIAMYSMIQFCSVSLLYTQMSTLGDFQFLFIDLAMILPTAVFMGRTEASEKIHRKRPTAKLVSRKVLLPLLSQVMLQVFIQAYLFFSVRNYDWYYYSPPDPSQANIVSFENTTLFLISTFQYIIVAVVYSVGPPYRKSMTSNRFLLGTLAGMTALCLIFLLGPGAWISSVLQLETLPMSFRLLILLLAVLNLVLSLLLQHVLLPQLNSFISNKLYIKHEQEVVSRYGGSGLLLFVKRWLGFPRLKTGRKQFKIIIEDYHRANDTS